MIEQTENAFRLNAASGIVEWIDVIDVQIGPPKSEAKQYVLNSTLDVLSVGYRRKMLGYGFHWKPYSDAPSMTLPGNVGSIKLDVVDCCPYLVDYDLVCKPVFQNLLGMRGPTKTDAKVSAAADPKRPATSTARGSADPGPARPESAAADPEPPPVPW